MPLIADQTRNFLQELTGERLVPPASMVDYQFKDALRPGWSQWQQRRIQHFNASGYENGRLRRHSKEFPWAPFIPLQIDHAQVDKLSLTDCLLRRASRRDPSGGECTFEELSNILYYGGGCKPDGRLINASGGARHTLEVSVCALRVSGLEAGVYHFHPYRNGLERISQPAENWLENVYSKSEERLMAASFIIFLTAIPARTTIKYGHFGYRMVFAEIGHLSQSYWLLATGLGIKSWPMANVHEKHLRGPLQMNPQQEFFGLSVIMGR